ncbi:DedA family protein|uniref:Membrane protein DedA, SNARE-associated domain n=1 Tax=Dendrosporobacter quercicolus TaxID=146817 RepID=A0A1G9Q2Q0_9FIRM|nr:DedA family protein [Dendrosporobacter quercicolus]NSL48099.1 DedA family protein [Dendrosporobacter quercicolus DSM 1736]SDM05276.1 membrane protein DedA, SNARE-associated domain [Dendrosporobacter quercicolus]
MEEFSKLMIAYIAAWGYPALVLALMLANIGVPVPSEITLGFAGFLVFGGQLEFAPVIVSGIIGEVLGACLAYGLGYYGGTAFLVKYGRLLGLSFATLERRRHWLNKYGAATIFFGRLLPVARGLIALPAGFIRIDFWLFFLCTGFSSVIWVVVLVYMGQLLGESWREVDAVGYGMGKAVFILVLLAAAAFLYRKRRLRGFQH